MRSFGDQPRGEMAGDGQRAGIDDVERGRAVDCHAAPGGEGCPTYLLVGEEGHSDCPRPCGREEAHDGISLRRPRRGGRHYGRGGSRRGAGRGRVAGRTRASPASPASPDDPSNRPPQLRRLGREDPLDAQACRQGAFGFLVADRDAGISGGQDDRLPALLGQVGHVLESPQNAHAADGREVVGDDQDLAHQRSTTSTPRRRSARPNVHSQCPAADPSSRMDEERAGRASIAPATPAIRRAPRELPVRYYAPMPRTIMCVVGARPNFMKMAPLLAAIRRRPESLSAHPGPHRPALRRGHVRCLLRQLGMPRPDVHLGIGPGSHAAQTGRDDGRDGDRRRTSTAGSWSWSSAT
jgi:hypothetical protein